MRRYFVCVIAVFMAVAFMAIDVFAQGDEGVKAPAEEGMTPAGPTGVPATAAAPQAETPKSTELSIYGEVQSVNTQALSVTVQYYDYDNDEEKSIEIMTDKDTKMENAGAISEINKGDWVDVSYTAAGGKNMAKMVSVEKEEPFPAENATMPDEE